MSLTSKAALNKLLEVVRNADQTFLDPDKNLDAQGHADGYRHLFHLLRTTIDFYLFNDPLRPSFMLLSTEDHKILGDNVDAVYYFTQLRGDQEYVIRGKRFDSCYLSFCTYGGSPTGEIVDRVANNINHTQIAFEPDGSFEIRLTPNPTQPNDFKLHDDVVNLFTREYFFDRFHERESVLSIENTQALPPPKPMADEELAARIATMTTFFEQTTWIAPLPVEFPINDFLPPFPFDADQGGWGTVDNVYCFGRYRLAENECLEIRFTSPPCCYWGMQSWNYLMQSMDWRHYQVGLNKGNAEAKPDGSYTIYVSHVELPVANRISTAGYQEAILFCRWLLVETLPEQPQVRMLKVSEVV